MPIIQLDKGHNFKRDKRLSWKARGILAYLLDHDDTWEVTVQDLIQQSDADGRIAVQSALQELIEHHYAKLVPVRDERGRVKGKKYVVYSAPYDLTDRQVSRSSENRSVGTDKQVIRRTENMPVGETEFYAVPSDHRRAGFPTIGKTDGRETCLITKTEDLKKKNKTEEENPCLRMDNGTLSPPEPTIPSSQRKRTRPPDAKLPSTAYTPGFEHAWAAYPSVRKEGKVATFTLWRERGLEPRAEEIATKLDRLTRTLWAGREKKYIPLPETWFRQARYEDDLVPLEVVRHEEARARMSDREYRSMLAGQRFVENAYAPPRRPRTLPADDAEDGEYFPCGVD